MTHGIYKGDCIELMQRIDNDTIDCCITDPPYGVNFQSSHRTESLPKILNDEAPFVDWIPIVFQKLKLGGALICFYRWDVQDAFLNALVSAGFSVKSQIVWDKMAHGMGDLKSQFAPAHELMLFAVKGKFEFHSSRPNSIYRCPHVGSNQIKHPNEKPVNLIAALVRDLTKAGDTVIDPFGGSFSTYKACIKEGRRCITYELHDEYFDLERSARTYNEVTLFQ